MGEDHPVQARWLAFSSGLRANMMYYMTTFLGVSNKLCYLNGMYIRHFMLRTWTIDMYIHQKGFLDPEDAISRCFEVMAAAAPAPQAILA